MSKRPAVSDAPRPRRLIPGPPPPEPPPPVNVKIDKIPRAAVACKPCRDSKNRCSGAKPTCQRCAKRHIQCQYPANQGAVVARALQRKYDDLRDRASAQEDIIELLKNRPEQDAQDILRSIRSGTDVATIVNHVRAGDLLLQMSVAPETRFRYQFPYLSEMPQELMVDNPYTDTLIFEATSLYSEDQQSQLSRHVASRLGAGRSSGEHQSLYLKPFHAAQVIEPRLTTVKISVWTAVCSDDALMRDLLEVFFRCEYQFCAAFQKDYFLEDMAAKRKDFCSSLLVNIVLAYSCICYPRFSDRAEYWNPHNLGYSFLAEAKRLWELEAADPHVTTVQAGILFSVFHNLCGLDKVGQPYRIQGVALAHKLGLFDSAADDQNERMKRGRAYTAWTLYNWETLVAFSFNHPPLVKTPPSWILPDPSKEPQWYGEIWVKYPLNHGLSPSYFGHIFKSKSLFRIIMNEFCEVAFSNAGMSPDKANHLRVQLEGWYQNLPSPLRPEAIALPGHLQLHIYYHHLLLSIYEPLVDVSVAAGPPPEKIVADSNKALQTLVRIYYLRHGFEAMDLFIVIPLMLAAFGCISAIDEHTPAAKLESLRSTLILVAQGLYNQRRNHYLARALFRVVQGKMRPQEVALLRDSVDIEADEAEGKRTMEQAVRSNWPVTVVKKKEEIDSCILGNLVEDYAHLNVGERSETEDYS